ncbi:MAG: delta-60 repeat domain-containing protein [Planctomycetes bacterium]|nr:delta-60 repeat domain-containing protein [Planctomycetota bacterium]
MNSQQPSRSPSPRLPLPAALVGLIVTTLATTTPAQCTNTIVGDFGCPGVGGVASCAIAWDPDGPGPLGARLVVGGDFRTAGTIACAGLAAFDQATATWSALPAPPLPHVTALAVLPNHQLVLACHTEAFPQPGPGRVAVLTGSTWTTLGGDFDHWVLALHVRPGGELLAAGDFTQHGGQPLPRLARWNGSAWTNLGGVPDGKVTALASLPNGLLLAGGYFTAIGAVPAANVAAWNGSTWSPFGTIGSPVEALLALPQGLAFAGSHQGLQAWNGLDWTLLPGLASYSFPNPVVHELALGSNSTVLVGGHFDLVNGQVCRRVAAYNLAGGTWSTAGTGLGDGLGFGGHVASLVPGPGGTFYAAGAVGEASGRNLAGVARWDGAQWRALNDGVPPRLTCALPLGGDRVVIGGRFASLGNLAAESIAEWNGTNWQPLGSGLTTGLPYYETVEALARLPNGDLLAGGSFTFAGSIPANALARWNGSQWSAAGGGVTALGGLAGLVYDLLPLPDGRIVVGGQFSAAGGQPANNIAVFDGTGWQTLGGGVPDFVRRLARAPNGDLIAAGRSVYRWNGSQWTLALPMFSSHDIRALAVRPNDEIVIGGVILPGFFLNQRGFVQSTSGLSLLAEDHSTVDALHVLPNGDLLAAGSFGSIGGGGGVFVFARGLVRVDATGGLTAESEGSGIRRFAADADGSLWLAGFLLGNDGSAACGLGRLVPGCPAFAQPSGAGCSGSGGANQITSWTLPWLGSVHRTRATGMPANGLAVHVLGLAPVQLPLAALLPEGVPGCSLLAQPDILGLLVPQAGAVETSFPVPDAASLVGLACHEQVLAFDLAAGGITAITGTQGLTLVLGSF